MEFMKDITMTAELTKLEHHIKEIKEQHIGREILEDVIFPIKKKAYKKRGLPAIREEERFLFFRQHPFLCGVTAALATLEVSMLGFLLCNQTQTVLLTGHLYNALRQKHNPIKECKPSFFYFTKASVLGN